MKGMNKFAAGFFLAATLSTSVAMTNTAHAGSKGRKNTAIAVGAVAVHQLLTGKTSTGVIAGAGAAAAYKRYKDSKDSENRGSRRRARNNADWFDKLTGKGKDSDNVRYRRNENRNRDRDRVSRRNENRNRDRYDDRYDRYEDRTDRYEDRYEDNRYDDYVD